MELDDFQYWLLENKKINISTFIQEYRSTKPTLTRKDVLIYLAKLHKVFYIDLIRDLEGKKRISNDLVRARGHLVKYMLEHDKSFTATNAYMKLFGISKDRTTSLHFLRMQFIGDELNKYNELSNFITNNNIKWDETSN